MNVSKIFIFFTVAVALVCARTFRGSSFGDRSTSTFGRGARTFSGTSFGRRSASTFGRTSGFSRGFSKGTSKGFSGKRLTPKLSENVPGSPCEDDGTCTGDHQVCINYMNTDLCFVKRKEGESCSGRFDSCQDSVCKLDGFRKTCLPDDGMAATGEICDSARTCRGTNDVCKPCQWKFGENRCVKMVKEGEECSIFEMCEAPGVCEKSAGTKQAICVSCPLVCPLCHIPNDTCDACVLDPTAKNCDPCGFDANGENGHALCAELTGNTKFKCCPPSSDCTGPSGKLESLLTGSDKWNPSTLICSTDCDGTSAAATCASDGKVCTPGDAIVLPSGGAISEIPTCSCALICPNCNKPNEDCDGCVIDDTADPTSCDPCAADPDGWMGTERCVNLGKTDCCAPTSYCLATDLPGRFTPNAFDTRTFICSDTCDNEQDACDDENTANVCTVGDAITLPAGTATEVNEILPCQCDLMCPLCHKPNDFCTKCVFDWTAPENCDPCAPDAGGNTGDKRCAAITGDFTSKCCGPSTECTKPGGVIDKHISNAFNPSTLVCSIDCGSQCDKTENHLCSIDAEGPIAFDSPDEDEVSSLDACTQYVTT